MISIFFFDKIFQNQIDVSQIRVNRIVLNNDTIIPVVHLGNVDYYDKNVVNKAHRN